MAIFKGAKNRDDTFLGGGKADTFLFDPADLTSGDVIVGGGGQRGDTLQFTASGVIGASAFVGVSGIERIILADGANSIVLNDALVSTANGARVQVVGGSGDDLVYAATLTGANAIDVVAGGGADLLLGGLGADSFTFAISDLDELDVVTALNGGTADRLVLTGSGSVSAAQLAGVTEVEAISLGDGGVQIVLPESIVLSAEGTKVTVSGGSGADTIHTSLETYNGGPYPSYTLLGGGGDDVIVDATPYGSTIDGGEGADTIDARNATVVYDSADLRQSVAFGGNLIVLGAATIDLTKAADQSAGDTCVVQGFTAVDASASTSAVSLTMEGYGTLIGGAADDVITGGTFVRGGKGADTMIGSTQFGAEFYIGAGEFKTGEMIVGNTTYDRLTIVGSTDFRRGTLQGIDYISVTSDGDEITRVSFNASQVASMTNAYFYSPNQFDRLEVAIYLDGSNISPSFHSFYGHFTIYGSAAADVVNNENIYTDVKGRGGDDIITVSGSVDGGAGDDHISSIINYSDTVIDGESGIDTFIAAESYIGQFSIDLSSKENQFSFPSCYLLNFENVDFSASLESSANIRGSNAANEITGTSGRDVIAGRGGDDILDGGAYSPDTLIGGAGADIFRWTFRDLFTQGGQADVIRDFETGHDHLQFAKDAFDFDGRAFDTLVVSSDATTNISDADLVIFTGGPLDSIQDVVDYLLEAAGGHRDEGVFVAGVNSQGHTMLFHALDASFTALQDVAEVADLGRIGQPADILHLTDFLFI